MQLNTRDGKTYALLSDLREWEKNPRVVGPVAFQRLKDQILRLGEYKPLVITEDGLVLGGNTRLKAYRDLGFQEAWVSIVDTSDPNKVIEYNLSDNDNVGFYNDHALANLVSEFEFDPEDYAVDFGEPIVLADLMKDQAKQSGQGKGSDGQFGGQHVTCPECGHEFTPEKPKQE